VRAAALLSVNGLLIYMLHAWGDLGLGIWTGVFTTGACMAVAGKAAEFTAAEAKAAPAAPGPTQTSTLSVRPTSPAAARA
jgi:hypothetical protein